MGNICSRLCNQDAESDETNQKTTQKANPQQSLQISNAHNSHYRVDPKTGKKVFQSSLVQDRISKKLRRPSGVHFSHIRNKFNADLDVSMEKPCRSKEDLRHIYKFLTKNIGEGGFGYVCKACLKSNPDMIYAIKQVDKNQHKEDLEIFLQEIELMKVLDHPNIVKFFQVYEDDDYFYMVLEYLDGGELIERMEKTERFREDEIKNYFWQMLLAVRYMNKRRLAHRDIKPENFMFKKKDGDVIKLIDFGLSQCFTHKNKMRTLAGSPYYLAPEVIMQDYTYKCDVWSLGVILYEMAVDDLPFYAENNKDLFEIIKKGEYDNQRLRSLDISAEMIDLLEKMLVVDEDKRIDIVDALKHDWFAVKLQQRLKGLDYLSPDLLQNMKDFTVNSQLQREMIGLMVQSFQEHDEIDKLVKIFNALDKDFSGTLQKNEIMKLFERQGVDISEEEVEDIIDSLFIKEQGIVSFLEWIAANLDRDFYAQDERLRLFFGFMDLDKSGEIEAKEISDVFKRFGRNLSSKKINAMIQEVDQNSDKKIDYEEFKVIMNFDTHPHDLKNQEASAKILEEKGNGADLDIGVDFIDELDQSDEGEPTKRTETNGEERGLDPDMLQELLRDAEEEVKGATKEVKNFADVLL